MDGSNQSGGEKKDISCGNCGRGCGCVHHKVMPLLVVVFGLVFLLGALGKMSMETVNVVWPVIVIIAGLKKMAMGMGMCKCC
jgi:hypothetical protein